MYILCTSNRTENDPRPRSLGVKCTVMILMIIIVTIVAVTFLCTHYTPGRLVAEIPESTVIHRHTGHSGNNKNGVFEKSTAADIDDLDVSDTSVGRNQLRILPTESMSDSTGDQRMKNFHLAKHPWTGESRNRVWPSLRLGRLTDKTNPQPADRHRKDIADRTVELRDINSRSNRHNHHNTISDEWTGQHSFDDLTYGLDHNDTFKHTGTHLNGGLKSYYSFDNGAYYGPTVESPSTFMHYRPSLRPPPIYPALSPQTKILISKKEKLDWHTIGLLTLIKAGLIKLKLFGILKIMFLLLFKLKMFLIAIFVKFLLLLKSSKLIKTLFLPLLILPLFLILMTLILPIIMSVMYLLLGQSLNMMSPAPTSSISNLLSSLISNLPGIPGIPARPGLTKSFTSDIFPNIPKNILAGRSGTLKFNDFNFNYKHDHTPIGTIDTALDIFKKLLDSEKSVETIACQIAAVGKADIMPEWINRLLNSILSMYIAIEKGKTYDVMSYDDVNSDILTNFSEPDNWITWCMERYHCNRTIISNTTET